MNAILQQINKVQTELNSLRAMIAATGNDALKNPDGTLTEKGIAAVEKAFENGASRSDVVERFGIHYTSAKYRHEKWMKKNA